MFCKSGVLHINIALVKTNQPNGGWLVFVARL